MRVSYGADYYTPLPEGHPFPMAKFPALHALLLREEVIRAEAVVAPRPADWSDLLWAHTPAYLKALAEGALTRRAERRMGLPWSKRLIHRSRVAVQGTINAAFMALEDGVAANLAGGTHHAYPGHGEGFCVLNDIAVAVRLLQRRRWVRRVLIVDLDVHQGNGNAAFFADDAGVFTFSMHGAKNYPFRKPPSSLDLPLPDGTGDDAYLDVLERHLGGVIEAARPDLAFYLGGIDVLAGDRYGRLALSPAGLRARDGYVLEALRRCGLPVALLLSGGYAETPERTAGYHAIMHREARRVFG